MMASFNVLTDGWIPVVHPDGRREELGILDTLRLAHELAAIRDPSPLVEFGLYRLLVAFVFDVLSQANKIPRTPRQLKSLLETAQFDGRLLEAYAGACGNVFDLFDPERPFLQTVAAGGGEKPLAALYPAVPSGTNVHHWHHAVEAAMGASSAGAARLLTTLAPFMTAGGAGLSPSINGAPAIYALPVGKNLFETLVLNLPLRQAGTGAGRVAWRDDRVPGGERNQATMSEALTWRARRVRLLPPDAGAGGKVTRMLFQAGDSTRLTWVDPNLAYKYDGEDATPVRMREGRPLWRDAGPLALLKRGAYKTERDKFEYRRPDVIEYAFEVTEAPLRIRVYGIRTDLKMKVFEWAASELLVPSEVGRAERVGALVQRWLDLSEAAGRALRGAIRGLYPREGGGNKSALGRTVELAEHAYWSALENQFHDLLFRAATLSDEHVDDVERVSEVLAPWKTAIRRNAVTAFESIAKDYDADADALERAVAARGRLGAALKRILA
ncbi:MAG TPA: type I-E CRISPR-associated protein Cse1/CasA [Armatimonadota bacterium]|nr:type I-E CRISPR-associated protein Cse1/CasA [Armatimonadota bacterium]